MSSNEASFKLLHIVRDYQVENEDAFTLNMQMITSLGQIVLVVSLTDEESRELKDFADRVSLRVRQSLKESL